MEYHGITWNNKEHHGILWNIMKSHEILTRHAIKAWQLISTLLGLSGRGRGEIFVLEYEFKNR